MEPWWEITILRNNNDFGGGSSFGVFRLDPITNLNDERRIYITEVKNTYNKVRKIPQDQSKL